MCGRGGSPIWSAQVWEATVLFFYGSSPRRMAWGCLRFMPPPPRPPPYAQTGLGQVLTGFGLSCGRRSWHAEGMCTSTCRAVCPTRTGGPRHVGLFLAGVHRDALLVGCTDFGRCEVWQGRGGPRTGVPRDASPGWSAACSEDWCVSGWAALWSLDL